MKEIIEKIFNSKVDAFMARGIDIYNNFAFLVLIRFKNDLIKAFNEEENKPFDPLQLSDEFIDCGLIELDEGVFYCWSLFLDGFLYQNKKYEHLVIYQNKNDLYTFALEFDEERQLKEPNVDIVKDVEIPNHRFGKELLQNLGVIECTI